MTPSLTFMSGPLGGHRVDFTEDVLIVGRENADILLDDPEVSRRHASLRRTDGGVEVEDLGSTNGTLVDGARISSPIVLTHDARVRIGSTEIEVKLGDRAETTTAGERPEAAETALRPVPVAVPPPPSAAPSPKAAGGQADGRGRLRAPAPAPFAPPSPVTRRRGPATRLWIPTAASFATIGATAAALIAYFAGR